MTLFNTQHFGLFEYSEKSGAFAEMKVTDYENLAEGMPKHFKQVYLGNEVEAYLIAGGFDQESLKASPKAYIVQRGVLKSVMPMLQGRMNHTMIVVQAKRKPKDRESNFDVYAIGGYSLKDGALSRVEKWSYDT